MNTHAAVLFFTSRAPEYSGDEDVVHLNPESFQRLIAGAEAEPGTSWLVFFYADWCSACDNHVPLFAKLSVE
jgi:thiol-disulfide isomerase/thioredoxin